MNKIEQEIEQMAENMAKGGDPKDKLFSVIKALGPEGLKAKLSTLSDDEKLVLKAAIEEMNLQKAVTFDKEAQSAKMIQGNIMDTVIQEDIASDDADEKLMKPAAAHFDHQGTPTDGWEGQVIKAYEEMSEEEVEKLSTPFKHLITELPDDFSKAYVGFEKLKGKLASEKGVDNPAAVAASIGRKKYGKKQFQNAAAEGKKMKKSEVVEALKSSDELLNQFIDESLDRGVEPTTLYDACVNNGLEKSKIMNLILEKGAMKKAKEDEEAKNKIMAMEAKEHGTKDPKKLVQAEKKEHMKKSGTESQVLKEEENPEAKKQDGDAPNLEVGGQNRSGAKKGEAKNISNVGEASKNAQKEVDNLNPETMAKGMDPADKDAKRAEQDQQNKINEEARKKKKENEKEVKKSVSWEQPNHLLKANTRGRNFHFNVEHFVSETLANEGKTQTGEIKKSEKVDLNDLIEKSQDRNWDQLNHEREMAINAGKINGKLVKSFGDEDIASVLGLSPEEAKKILG